MKVGCLREKLKEAVIIAERLSGHNLTLPILNTILLKADKKSLVIKATNLEVGVEIEVPAKIEEEGIIAINANILSSFLNNLTNEVKINLNTINDNLKITSENNSTLIKGLIADDFPLIPKIEQENSFKIDSNLLASSIRSVIFASSLSDIKPEIASVYVYNKDNYLIFTATDSFRLAEKKIELKDLNNQEQISLIIPFKNINEITKVIDSLNSELLVSFNKNQLVIKTNNLYLTLRIIDGVYPDYQQIIPKNFKTEINIKKDDLLNILKLATIFTDKFNQIDLLIKADKNLIEINSYSNEVGENKSTLITKIKGESLEVSFNAKYLTDFLVLIDDELISLKFTDKNHPLMMGGLNNESFSYLVMPINK